MYYRTIIYNVLITLSDRNTPIDFGLTRLKVKVTMVIFVTNNVNMVAAPYLENCLTQSFHTSYADLVRTTPIVIEVTWSKGKVTRVTKRNVNMVSVNYLENCLSQSFYISHSDWSW